MPYITHSNARFPAVPRILPISSYQLPRLAPSHLYFSILPWVLAFDYQRLLASIWSFDSDLGCLSSSLSRQAQHYISGNKDIMKVANLVSTEWSEQSRYSSQPHLSPAPSLSGSVRKYDEYREKPSPITTAVTTSYFSAVNSSQRASPQLPLSPPADDLRKCSLPSISSLLEGMDNMPTNSMLLLPCNALMNLIY
jgi:hypothetical protein